MKEQLELTDAEIEVQNFIMLMQICEKERGTDRYPVLQRIFKDLILCENAWQSSFESPEALFRFTEIYIAMQDFYINYDKKEYTVQEFYADTCNRYFQGDK